MFVLCPLNVLESDAGQVAAGIYIAVYRSTGSDNDICLIVGRDGSFRSGIVVFRVVIVDAVNIFVSVVAVVETIAAGINVLLYISARWHPVLPGTQYLFLRHTSQIDLHGCFPRRR